MGGTKKEGETQETSEQRTLKRGSPEFKGSTKESKPNGKKEKRRGSDEGKEASFRKLRRKEKKDDSKESTSDKRGVERGGIPVTKKLEGRRKKEKGQAGTVRGEKKLEDKSEVRTENKKRELKGPVQNGRKGEKKPWLEAVAFKKRGKVVGNTSTQKRRTRKGNRVRSQHTEGEIYPSLLEPRENC